MHTTISGIELKLKETADNFALKSYMDKINSITAYPSIPTLFKLGPKGDTYFPELNIEFGEEEYVFKTEKVDGTNIRVVFLPNQGGIVIGTRDDLLLLNGDTILDQNYQFSFLARYRGEIDHLVAELVSYCKTIPDTLTVVYVEMYGGEIGAGCKNYTQDKNCVGFSIFDIADIDLSTYDNLIRLTTCQISGWRKRVGPKWRTMRELRYIRDYIVNTPFVQVVGGCCWHEWKKTYLGQSSKNILENCYSELRRTINVSHAKLHPSGLDTPEGLVLRNEDRSKIAKIRFETLEKTFRVNEQKRRK